jgi:hypothetical protein
MRSVSIIIVLVGRLLEVVCQVVQVREIQGAHAHKPWELFPGFDEIVWEEEGLFGKKMGVQIYESVIAVLFAGAEILLLLDEFSGALELI